MAHRVERALGEQNSELEQFRTELVEMERRFVEVNVQIEEERRRANQLAVELDVSASSVVELSRENAAFSFVKQELSAMIQQLGDVRTQLEERRRNEEAWSEAYAELEHHFVIQANDVLVQTRAEATQISNLLAAVHDSSFWSLKRGLVAAGGGVRRILKFFSLQRV